MLDVKGEELVGKGRNGVAWKGRGKVEVAEKMPAGRVECHAGKRQAIKFFLRGYKTDI